MSLCDLALLFDHGFRIVRYEDDVLTYGVAATT